MEWKNTSTERKCCRCKIVKPISAFVKDSSRPSGYCFHCKQCACIQSKKYISKYRPRMYRTQEFRDNAKKLGRYTYKARKNALERYAIKNKDHISARGAVKRAVFNGSLKKESCQICSEPKVQAHHHQGYEKENWLIITWLCQEHHRQAHHGK